MRRGFKFFWGIWAGAILLSGLVLSCTPAPAFGQTGFGEPKRTDRATILDNMTLVASYANDAGGTAYLFREAGPCARFNTRLAASFQKDGSIIAGGCWDIAGDTVRIMWVAPDGTLTPLLFPVGKLTPAGNGITP